MTENGHFAASSRRMGPAAYACARRMRSSTARLACRRYCCAPARPCRPSLRCLHTSLDPKAMAATTGAWAMATACASECRRFKVLLSLPF
eukprot:5373013-Pleurochrysis_carterae.AAC.1